MSFPDPCTLTNNESSLLKNEIPLIKRSRGYRLYGADNKRYIDFYQEGGKALLGHRPPGWTGVLKSTGSRGLFASYPTLFSGRARKAALSLFPWAADALFFPGFSSAASFLLSSRKEHAAPSFFPFRCADPLTASGEELMRENTIPLWRPCGLDNDAEKALKGGRWGRWCMPILPLPGEMGPVLLLDIDGSGTGVKPALPPLSAIQEDLAVKAVSGLKAYLDSTDKEMWGRFDLPGVFRRGPYLLFQHREEESRDAYSRFFARMLDEGLLLPPDPREPAIIPAEFTDGEVKPLIRELRRNYADR
ncbi:MAG: hypothetical protein R6V67_01420 [Spirochaetia bacterium]